MFSLWRDQILQSKWRGLDFVYVPLRVKPVSLILNYSQETSRNLQPLRQHDKHYLNKLCITHIIYILTSYLRIIFWRIFYCLVPFWKDGIILNFQIFALYASSKILVVWLKK